MKSTDQIIREYKDIYHILYGRYPLIQRNGPWIYLNGSNIRRYDLLREKKSLSKKLRMKELKELKEKVIWNTKNEEYFTANIEDYSWNKYIKHDLLKSFLDKMLELCNHSVFDMEKLIKDFISGDRGIIQSDCYNCRKKIELETAIAGYRSDIVRLKTESILKEEKLKVYENQIDLLIKELKELKENSVLFTMNDLKYQNSTKKRLRRK